MLLPICSLPQYNVLPMNKEGKNAPIRQLRYVNEPDREWQELMQEPKTQDYIRNTFLDIPPEDWPDQIILADLPQVPQNQIDVPIKLKVGRCEGPIQKSGEVQFVPSDVTVTLFRPKSTRFIRVILEDGREAMERYDQKRHGEWDDIPDTGLTPAELLDRLYGFGESIIEHGQQFQNTRKEGTAKKTRWKPRHHYSPRVRGYWKK